MAEGQHKGLVGLFSVEGTYQQDPDKPNRQSISFTHIRLEPIDTAPEKLQAWLDLTKPSNPDMVHLAWPCRQTIVRFVSWEYRSTRCSYTLSTGSGEKEKDPRLLSCDSCREAIMRAPKRYVPPAFSSLTMMRPQPPEEKFWYAGPGRGCKQQLSTAHQRSPRPHLL